MELIKEKLQKLREEEKKFSNKARLDEDKIYIPEVLLSSVNILEFIAVVRDIKPVFQNDVPEDRLEDLKKILKEIRELYGLNFKISNYKFLINSNTNFTEVVPLSDPRKGRISFSVSKYENLAELSEHYFLKKSLKQNCMFYSRKFGELMGYPECCLDFGDKLSGNVGKKI
ncbi:MAG: hypothetical protein QXY62_03060 [Candidatus Altiarchaeota archaeon]